MKRNQIIQRWLQSIEDPENEVILTKKEGKYIVKLREKNETPVEIKPETPPVDSESENPLIVTKPQSRIEVPSSTEPMSHWSWNSSRSTDSISSVNFAPQTINLEILEKLRNLGEDIRNDIFKKEQKQYIKHVVNKELSKSRIRSRYIPDLMPEVHLEPESVKTDLVTREQESVKLESETIELICQANVALLFS